MKNQLSNAALFLLSVGSMLLLMSLAGCSSSPPISKSRAIDVQPLGNAELYTHELASELFHHVALDPRQRYAVTGFVPSDTFSHNPMAHGPLMILGQQLEQGLMTEAVKRGFTAQEYKLTRGIVLSSHIDRALSRQVAELAPSKPIDFYITGTITYQQSGALVNARIVDAISKDVVAAASKFFPDTLFWKTEQVTTRGGRLYRTEQPLSGASI